MWLKQRSRTPRYEPADNTMSKPARTLLLFVLAISTVGCDRVTKHFAKASLDRTAVRSFFGDTVRLEYAENRGGFLSMGADWPRPFRTVIFGAGTGVVLLALLITAIQFRSRTSYLVGACLAAAGGASNLFDRFTQHAVVDFLNVGLGNHLRTGIFNVADVAILFGMGVMMFSLSRSGYRLSQDCST